MKTGKLILAAAIAATLYGPAVSMAEGTEAMITPTMESIDVMHNGKKVTIKRDHDKDHTIPAPYNKTSRGCPPFCIQPAVVVPGVETVGELEVIAYLKKAANGDKNVIVIDSRTPEWIGRGTIPGSVNIPWNKINADEMSAGFFATPAESEGLEHILKDEFGAAKTADGWDFSNAKTLVLFCNGSWCGQSSSNIKTLVRLGYPVSKLKWYRGGMQDWVSLGLSTVTE